FPQRQHVIEAISHASNRGGSAIEVGGKRAFGGFGRIELHHVLREAAARPEMHMYVNQAREHGLPGGLDRIGVEELRIRWCAFIDFSNFTLLDENRSGLYDLSIAYENTGVLDEPVVTAPQVALDDFRFGQ